MLACTMGQVGFGCAWEEMGSTTRPLADRRVAADAVDDGEAQVRSNLIHEECRSHLLVQNEADNPLRVPVLQISPFSVPYSLVIFVVAEQAEGSSFANGGVASDPTDAKLAKARSDGTSLIVDLQM